jgi:hypothetical protein
VQIPILGVQAQTICGVKKVILIATQGRCHKQQFITQLLRQLNATALLESKLWLQGMQMQFHKFKEMKA